MKTNKFFITVLLGAVVLSSTNFEMQASQSWYDWGTSGLSSAMSSIGSMYGQLPSISASMSNVANSLSQTSKEKWLMAIGVALLGTAGGTALYKWYQKYKAEQDKIAKMDKNVTGVVEIIFRDNPNPAKKYKKLIDNLRGPMFWWFMQTEEDEKNFVLVMNDLLKMYYEKSTEKNNKESIKLLKFDENSKKIIMYEPGSD